MSTFFFTAILSVGLCILALLALSIGLFLKGKPLSRKGCGYKGEMPSPSRNREDGCEPGGCDLCSSSKKKQKKN